MKNLLPFDYFKIKTGDIFITRFNNFVNKYVIAALIYAKSDCGYDKCKSYTKLINSQKLASKKNKLFGENLFDVPYHEITEIYKPNNIKALSLINDLELSLKSYNLSLIGSRLIFEDKYKSDFDFLYSVKSVEDIEKIKISLENESKIHCHTDEYYTKKAQLYSDVSFTTQNTLFRLTKESLLYYKFDSIGEEIAFFPYFKNNSFDMELIQLIELAYNSNNEIIEIEGVIAIDNELNSYSFPRVFNLITHNRIYTVFSLLWRIGGVGLLHGNNMKINAIKLSANKLLLSMNSKWELL